MPTGNQLSREGEVKAGRSWGLGKCHDINLVHTHAYKIRNNARGLRKLSYLIISQQQIFHQDDKFLGISYITEKFSKI